MRITPILCLLGFASGVVAYTDDELQGLLQKLLTEKKEHTENEENLKLLHEKAKKPSFLSTNEEQVEDQSLLHLDEKQNCDVKGSFPSLEHAFMGYNVFYGYPLNAGPDPGFQSIIFESVFEPPKYTSDCRYMIPKGLTYQNAISCQVNFESKEVKDQKEYESSLNVHASVGGGGWGLSFSASASYKADVSELSTGETLMVISSANCNQYILTLDRSHPPPLRDAFVKAVQNLADNKESYFEFFTEYGTHFSTKMTFGSRFSKIHKMDLSQYKSIKEKGFSVEATASYEGVASVSASFGLSGGQRDAVDNFRKNVQTTVSTVGSQPPSSGDAMQWASETQNHPMPMQYSLTSIEELFTSLYFSDVSGVDYSIIRENIIKYKSQYAIKLREIGAVKTLEYLPLPKPKPKQYKIIIQVGDINWSGTYDGMKVELFGTKANCGPVEVGTYQLVVGARVEIMCTTEQPMGIIQSLTTTLLGSDGVYLNWISVDEADSNWKFYFPCLFWLSTDDVTSRSVGLERHCEYFH